MTSPAKAVAVTETRHEREMEVESKSIEEMTQKCDELQRNVLAEILSKNADTEYLKGHGMEGATDRDTFKSKVPVVSYEDIQPYIQRIANGDFSPILCAEPITEFFASSGTSGGESKLIPGIAEDMARRMKIFGVYATILNRYFPGLDKGKALNFLFIKEEKTTPGGLVVRTAVTSVCKSAHMPKDTTQTTSPIEAILCLDSFQSMYAQMLCGLYSRHQVNRIGAIFASSLLRAFRFLEVNYPDLCNDISTGVLNLKITDPDIRACMAKIMRPDPELAEFINHECRDENWEGIIRRIWPNTKYLDAIVTGSMAQYIPTLDYYSGGLPKVSSCYTSSECTFGFNLNPLCDPSEICYTMIPTMAYFEFIPVDDDSSDFTTSAPQPVDLADVEVGKEYEIVVTTYAGLYRYRVGDMIEVTGFHNSTPKVKFVRRKNVLLSIDVDKTNESDLQKAIGNASAMLKPFNTTIVEYTSYAETKTIPGHYVIYLELLSKDTTNGPSPDVLDKCCLEMEEALDTIYRQGRHLKTIGPLEIRVVKNGTFEALMDYAITRGASINQFKMPRCVKLKPMLELLESNIVSTHSSPSLPHWTP